MKLCRIGPPGREKPAVLLPDGSLRDASGLVRDFDGACFASPEFASLRRAIATAPVVPSAGVRFGVPVANVGKIVGLGMNYHAGVKRAGMTTPVEPLLFIKSTTCLAAADDPIALPPGADKLDWEVELAVVIGREASRVDEAAAAQSIAGYAVFNDLSERRWQNEQGGEWCKGKSADGFGPCGPWLVTADEIADPGKLDIWLDLNGQRQQDSNTSDMIFGVRFAVSYISRFMRLLPGGVPMITMSPGSKRMKREM